MTKFRLYLKDTNQTIAMFAKRVHLSPNFVSEIASGKKIPTLRTARDISLATGGIISVTHWIEDDGPAAQLIAVSSHMATDNPQHKHHGDNLEPSTTAK